MTDFASPLSTDGADAGDLERRFENLDTTIEDEFEKAIAKAGGVGALAMSAVFNDAAMPAGFMQRYSQLITWVNRAAGDWSIGNGAGRVDEKTKQEREEDASERALDEVSDWSDQMDFERQQREEHYTKWLDEEHTYAGQTMDGKDWDKLIKWLDDPANEQDWEDSMMAETGQSRSEVKQTRDKIKRYTSLMQKIADGTATAAEIDEFNKLDTDQDVRTGIKVAKEREAYAAPASGAALTAQATDDKSVSVESRTDLVAARADLDAEPLTPKYNAASSGTVASEPQVKIAAVQPVKVPVKGLSADLEMG